MTNKTKPQAKHFKYLDALRDSGATNMFGARPYLAGEFGLDKKEAGEILSAWMETFDGASPVADRIAKAEGKEAR